MVDGVPMLSQAKSFVQFVTGNRKGAKRTQITFLKQCPVLSHGMSCVQWMKGNVKGAEETQIQFVKGVGSMVDAMPGFGHLKGFVHYSVGDKKGGNIAMKAASRSACVLGGSVGGFLVGGPVGAVGGGIYAGIAADSIISGFDYVANGEDYELYGSLDTVQRVIHDPTDGGTYVDLVGGFALDGITGYGTGRDSGNTVRSHRSGIRRRLVKKSMEWTPEAQCSSDSSDDDS